ncbi:hypothetical protein HDU84_004623 [Entophlyctis sp. JEL0112]|nr:hypothetical protein HDU84_004623 [Entophlyctis sp. JEL0112]
MLNCANPCCLPMPLPPSPSLSSSPSRGSLGSRDSRVPAPVSGGLAISQASAAPADKRVSAALSARLADRKRRSVASAALRRSAFLELSAEVQNDSLDSDSSSDSDSGDSIVAAPANDEKKQAGHRSKRFSLDDYALAYDSVVAEVFVPVTMMCLLLTAQSPGKAEKA